MYINYSGCPTAPSEYNVNLLMIIDNIVVVLLNYFVMLFNMTLFVFKKNIIIIIYIYTFSSP